MYSRSVSGQDSEPLHFGVSGKLWHGVLVMFDRESGSLWTQLDGRAIEGAHQGSRLTHHPSTFTTWAAWRAEHPDTEVLKKDAEAREQKASHYAEYFEDPDRLFLPHLSDNLGGVGPKDTVFGVVASGEPTAVTADLLQERIVVNALSGRAPIAWIRHTATGEVLAVDRRLGSRLVILDQLEGADPRQRLLDTVTGTPVDVSELRKLRVDRSFWYAWSRSHPGSVVITN